MQLVPQISTGARSYVLLVADAPVDVLESDHRSLLLLGLDPVVETPRDPFASLGLLTLGSAHVASGLSC